MCVGKYKKKKKFNIKVNDKTLNKKKFKYFVDV